MVLCDAQVVPHQVPCDSAIWGSALWDPPYGISRYENFRFGVLRYGDPHYETRPYGISRYEIPRFGALRYGNPHCGTRPYGISRYWTPRLENLRYHCDEKKLSPCNYYGFKSQRNHLRTYQAVGDDVEDSSAGERFDE